MERWSEYWVRKLLDNIPKKVNFRYRFKTLLKQTSLQVFLNYCTNILVAALYISWVIFKGAESATQRRFVKKVFLKNLRIWRKALVTEPYFKVAGCFEMRLRHRFFSVNFSKFKKRAMFRRTSTNVCFWNSYIPDHLRSPFLKRSVFFDCLNIKNKKTWYFLIRPPATNFLQNGANQTYFWLQPIPEKIQIGGVEDIEFQEVLRKERAEIRGSSKKEVDFPGVIKKNLCGFSIGLGFLVLSFQRGVAQFYGISRVEACFLRIKWQIYKSQGFFFKLDISSTCKIWPAL